MLKRLTCCGIFNYDSKAILDSSGWHAESAKHKCQASSIGTFIDACFFSSYLCTPLLLHCCRLILNCFTPISIGRCFKKSWVDVANLDSTKTSKAVLSLGDARACGDLANDKKNQRKGIRFFFSELTFFEGRESCPCVVAFAGGVPVERCLEIDQVA